MRSQNLIEAMSSELNQVAYREPSVVEYYASLDCLTECERLLFDRYIRPSMAVLDLGVGGGRTTPELSRRACRYIGLDYSKEMVEVCRKKFPELEFVHGDACNLSKFGAGSFDAVVFSFNGIDYFNTAEQRLRCIQECNRVLRDGGIFIFSTHNRRAIFVLPAWNPQKVRQFARRVVGPRKQLMGVAVALATSVKALQAAVRASVFSLMRMPRVFTAGFWRGEGYAREEVHGGLVFHHSIPGCVISEVADHGFCFGEAVGSDYPRSSGTYSTDWYYYVFAKEKPREENACK